MTTGPRSTRTEIRTPLKVLVELCSFENVTYELAYTVEVKSEGRAFLGCAVHNPAMPAP